MAAGVLAQVPRWFGCCLFSRLRAAAKHLFCHLQDFGTCRQRLPGSDFRYRRRAEKETMMTTAVSPFVRR